MYVETSIFIPAEITEDVVKSVAQNILYSSCPSGTELEVIQGWLLKSVEDSQKIVLVLKGS